MRAAGLLILLCVVMLKSFSQDKKPIVILNGKVVQDSLVLKKFDRIDYIYGKKAIELGGPLAAHGVLIISADGKIPVYGEVSSTSGKKIKNASVILLDGTTVSRTNQCGTFFLSAVPIGETLTIKQKGFVDEVVTVQQSLVSIKMKKK